MFSYFSENAKAALILSKAFWQLYCLINRKKIVETKGPTVSNFHKFLQIFAHKTYAPILDLIDSNETSIPSNLTYEHFTSASFNMPNVSLHRCFLIN